MKAPPAQVVVGVVALATACVEVDRALIGPVGWEGVDDDVCEGRLNDARGWRTNGVSKLGLDERDVCNRVVGHDVKTWAAIISVLALLATPVLAATPNTVFLEELTWPELRALIEAGKTTIILPIGGTEQNGPHMALGKHNVRVRALSERIARVLGNAVVGPVIAYVPEGALSPPSGHMRFPGTITVPEDVFRRSLESAARSARLHGFRDVVFLGEHGSTQAGEKAVAARLNREWVATPTRAHAIEEYYRAATAGFRDILRARGYRPEELGEHAGLPDTALTLAIDPSLVRTDSPRIAEVPGAGTGADGDPRRATAELGRLGVDLIVDRTVAAIRQSTHRR
jgi:creatinine amidohydrolase/Fe(II)-dependent formamide hydrolase-like protein